jgi:hypothetical protein
MGVGEDLEYSRGRLDYHREGWNFLGGGWITSEGRGIITGGLESFTVRAGIFER